MTLYDGPSKTSPIISDVDFYCGMVQPNTLLSTSHEILVHFQSDNDGNVGNGFELTYAERDANFVLWGINKKRIHILKHYLLLQRHSFIDFTYSKIEKSKKINWRF